MANKDKVETRKIVKKQKRNSITITTTKTKKVDSKPKLRKIVKKIITTENK